MKPESLPKSLKLFFEYLTSHDAPEISPQDFIDHWFDPLQEITGNINCNLNDEYMALLTIQRCLRDRVTMFGSDVFHKATRTLRNYIVSVDGAILETSFLYDDFQGKDEIIAECMHFYSMCEKQMFIFEPVN